MRRLKTNTINFKEMNILVMLLISLLSNLIVLLKIRQNKNGKMCILRKKKRLTDTKVSSMNVQKTI